jgi:hypothetical protein
MDFTRKGQILRRGTRKQLRHGASAHSGSLPQLKRPVTLVVHRSVAKEGTLESTLFETKPRGERFSAAPIDKDLVEA